VTRRQGSDTPIASPADPRPLDAAPGTRAIALRVARLYLAPRWKALAVAIACAIAFAVLSGLLLNILQPAVDAVTHRADPRTLLRLPLIIVALALARGAAAAAQAMLVNRIGNGIVGDVQLELFGKLVRADLARLRAAHSGGFVAQVLYDSGLIREAATTGVVNIVQNGLTLVAAGVVMGLKDWRLALVVLLAAPMIAVVLRRFMRRAIKAASGAMQATGALSTAIMEGLDGVRVVKMENREAYEEARVAAVIAERQRHIVSGDDARAVATPASDALAMVVVAAVLAYEGWRASSGHPDFGAFIAFFAALLMAGQALRQVSNLMTLVGQGVTAARRLFGALDVEPEVRDAPGAPALDVREGTIRMDGVSFAYGETPVLEAVDLEARRGEVVALVGPSGAGKTSLLNLIPRFYDITGGALTIDGQDVREVSLTSLRRAIGLVTQEPFLFDDTIAANIAYARDGASREEIQAAARAAAAHEFVEALPRGYDTLVGEAGARLSGGQRQRIAIARAFLKNAPILLLDEPTSALDTESEAQVQAALARLMAGRTTLIIAHRLSTVRGADRIYVLDAGKVAEVGAHEALMSRGGLYARLARAQDLTTLPADAA
jgi:subfamily B ATP-binding cassette protein MsbA